MLPLSAAALAADPPATPREGRPARPGETETEARCRREVERRFPPGTLSRNRGDRGQMVLACVQNGGNLP